MWLCVCVCFVSGPSVVVLLARVSVCVRGVCEFNLLKTGTKPLPSYLHSLVALPVCVCVCGPSVVPLLVVCVG